MPLKGIDVSSHQGVFPWESVRNNIDFAILRSSHGMNDKDSQFERNYAECKRLKIPVGVYHYFYYSDYGKHQLELKNFLTVIAGKTFEFPAFIDYEEGNFLTPSKLGALSKTTITNYAKEDIAKIKARGFKAGIYANTNWLTNKVDGTVIGADMVWLAQYAEKPTYTKHYDIWQFTSKGSIGGFSGNLDVNYYYPTVAQGVFNTLKIGDSSPDVVRMQNALSYKGYKCTVDGKFGSQTERVLKQFQTDNAIKSDGLYGKITDSYLHSFEKYSLKEDGEKYVTKNIKVKELRCNDGSDEIIIDKVAVDRAQSLRDKYGRAIVINSAYRTPAWNQHEGGASSSYHLKGMAIDFVIQGVDPAKVYADLNPTYRGGLGKYKRFTHIDTGPRRRWFG